MAEREQPDPLGETMPESGPDRAGRSPVRRRTKQDPYVGVQLGDTRVEKFLGKGGMANVYLGRQIQLDRAVAVKILASHLARKKAEVDGFMREAKLVARLEHPNVVNIYSVGQEEETRFLVMQLVEGGSLMDLLKQRGGKLPVQEAVAHVKQIAAGLAEAHSKGIIHRDIKPANVLVAPGPQMKITDFGLALMGDGSDGAFSAGKIVGTPHYISPEQVDAREVDARTDIYSLGATLYHMVCGKPPFRAPSPVELLVKHVSQPPTPPRRIDPEIPEGVSNIILKMLAKAPEDRYQTCAQVIQALEIPAQAAAPEPKPKRAPAERKPEYLLGERKLKPLKSIYKPIRPKRPPSFLYATAGLVLLTAMLVLGGLGPLQAVLGQEVGPVEPVDRQEQAARAALIRLEEAAAKLEPKDAIRRYREFAQDHAETVAGKKALERVKPLEQRVEELARAALASVVEQAAALRKKRELGPALDALRALDPALRPRTDAKAAVELEAAIQAELRQAGVAWIPRGQYVSGEGTRQRNRFLKAYYIDLREVTCAEYARFLEKHPQVRSPSKGWEDGQPPEGQEDLPVTGITIGEAMAYAEFRGMRLPSAYEWEKAARGAKGLRWPWGNARQETSCVWGGRGGRLKPAGSTTRDLLKWPDGDKSPFGCLDMAGNAAELTLGRRSTARAPRVWVRGGSADTRQFLNTRAAFYIDRVASTDRHPFVGFRCASSRMPKARAE